MNYREKVCKKSGHKWKQYNSLQKCPCSECTVERKIKAKPKKLYSRKIKPVSDKRKVLNTEYQKIRIEVLTEAKFKCFIEGCTSVATTCEHTKGKIGYADDWARENNIPLLIDKRYLKACCWKHNGELENNPELSHKYQKSKLHNEGKGFMKSNND